MFTLCPKCALTLAVTAGDLRVGQGYVRCGRCANVFNALLGLSEESASSATQNAPAAMEAEHPAPAPDPALGAALPPAAAPPALRLIEGPPRLPDVAAAAPGASSATEVEEFRGTGTFETIVLEGDTFLQTEEMVPEETFDNEIAALSRQLAAAQNTYQNDHADDSEDVVLDFSRPSAALSGMSEPAPVPAATPALTDSPDSSGETAAQFVTTRAATGWQAVVGLCLLALLLAGQTIHHWRNDLATHQGLFGPLERLYRAMGQPLTPNWNLTAYEVRQLGASSDGQDQHVVRVRLSLSNHALTPQIMPLVRLTLLDRYGKSLSAGEASPRQYLPAALQQSRWLDAEQRIDTELRVTDPSGQASSFELDVCVPAAGGGLRCGGDGAMLAANGTTL
jgi:predicted Zn finger-like uncharacterized protein